VVAVVVIQVPHFFLVAEVVLVDLRLEQVLQFLQEFQLL
jgi:hypothetical protein